MPAESVLGIEIPQGDPDALRSAAGVWGAVGDKLSAQADAMSDAAGAVVGADWYGPASLSYSSASSQVSIAYIGGSFACSTAAGAAKRHAADLEEAKTDAKAAIRDAIEANEEMGRQRKIASAAHTDRRMALQRADGAALRGATAQGAGPAGAGEVISAGNEESAARDEAGLAGDRAALAERRASDAADLLEQAQKRGHEAKRRGDRAGEVAARAYREVAGQAKPPLVAASPAVPVSLRGASPGILGMQNFNPFAGRFHTPGTPSHARAMQIALERAAADDRERELEGGADDRFGGEVKGLLGFRLFGDPNTRGFKRGAKLGEIASYFPSPGTVANLLRKGGQRGLREGGEEAAEEGGETIREKLAREAQGFRDTAKSGTYLLRKNLGDAPSGHQAHHLVPKGAYSTRNPAARAHLEQAQARMARLSIGPDDAANGIYLRPETHRKTFGNDYFEALDKRLERIDESSPNAKQEAIDELGRIGREIEKGVFP